MIRIHNFPRGARGQRVMWLCEEMGLAYEVAAVTFPPAEAYYALNPLGTAPFLEDAGGVAINESVAMLLYVAERYGPTPLLPDKDDPQFARVLQMTVFSEATFGAGMNPLMEAHFGAPEAEKRNWLVPALERRMDKALDYIARVLGEGPYIAGEAMSLADIALVTGFGVWRGALGKALPEPLAAYQARLAERPAYQQARARATAAA
jgi:glutathione S-transferase